MIYYKYKEQRKQTKKEQDMKKTLKVGYGEKAEKITIESTSKKLYDTAV